MARQSVNVRPWIKHLETFQDFSGGLNTTTTNSNLLNKETTTLVNFDIGDKGSVRRRNGMVNHLPSPGLGMMQGYFRYFKADGTFEEIIAKGGLLYKDGNELTIENLTSFQTTRMIEAVQFNDKLYIATGTKLVEYDGTTASVVVPHKPEPLEALYVGTNALSDNPDQYLSDGTAAYLRIEGVTLDNRYGVVNETTTATVYVSKPEGAVIEFKQEYKHETDSSWATAHDWSTGNVIPIIPQRLGNYELRFSARVQGDTTVEEYHIPQYRVTETDENEVIPSSTIHQCTRVILHWGRLIMYDDQNQKDVIYISHLNKPDYFPTTNSLRFENEWKEGITALVQYRDMLVCFTPSTIQVLYGKSPSEYRRVLLNASIGCFASETARVVENHVLFLARDGLYKLKSTGYAEDKANVERMDTKIEDLVPKDKNACAMVQDNQYHLVFPDSKVRLRYYYYRDVWAKDESDRLDFSRMFVFDNELYGMSLTGDIYRFDPTVWDDDGYVYEAKVETKYFEFGQPYHPKKLKELQILLGVFDVSIPIKLYVFADSQVTITPDKGEAIVNEDGSVMWQVISDPNVIVHSGTVFGGWEVGSSHFGQVDSLVHKARLNGTCRKTKMIITHQASTPMSLLGLGYIFKLKRA